MCPLDVLWQERTRQKRHLITRCTCSCREANISGVSAKALRSIEKHSPFTNAVKYLDSNKIVVLNLSQELCSWGFVKCILTDCKRLAALNLLDWEVDYVIWLILHNFFGEFTNELWQFRWDLGSRHVLDQRTQHSKTERQIEHRDYAVFTVAYHTRCY